MLNHTEHSIGSGIDEHVLRSGSEEDSGNETHVKGQDRDVEETQRTQEGVDLVLRAIKNPGTSRGSK